LNLINPSRDDYFKFFLEPWREYCMHVSLPVFISFCLTSNIPSQLNFQVVTKIMRHVVNVPVSGSFSIYRTSKDPGASGPAKLGFWLDRASADYCVWSGDDKPRNPFFLFKSYPGREWTSIWSKASHQRECEYCAHELWYLPGPPFVLRNIRGLSLIVSSRAISTGAGKLNPCRSAGIEKLNVEHVREFTADPPEKSTAWDLHLISQLVSAAGETRAPEQVGKM
jgi:hypothetical protein